MTINNVFDKVPYAVLDYVFDWKPLTNDVSGGVSDWLVSGETIASFEISSPSGIVLDASSMINGNTAVKIWLSGGMVPNEYEVVCKITTSNNPARKDTRSIIIRMVDRR